VVFEAEIISSSCFSFSRGIQFIQAFKLFNKQFLLTLGSLPFVSYYRKKT